MKRAVIIHCWGGRPEYCWYPDTARSLEGAGFTVSVPAMPNTDHPQFDEWMATVREVIGEPDEELYLIGHSLGCITILRYLETIHFEQRIGGVVFVAGFAQSLGARYEEIDSFFETPLNVEQVKTRVAHIVAIHSDNDPYVPLVQGKILERDFGAELLIKSGMRHFSGAIGEAGSCTALPDVAQCIIRLGAVS